MHSPPGNETGNQSPVLSCVSALATPAELVVTQFSGTAAHTARVRKNLFALIRRSSMVLSDEAHRALSEVDQFLRFVASAGTTSPELLALEMVRYHRHYPARRHAANLQILMDTAIAMAKDVLRQDINAIDTLVDADAPVVASEAAAAIRRRYHRCRTLDTPFIEERLALILG